MCDISNHGKYLIKDFHRSIDKNNYEFILKIIQYVLKIKPSKMRKVKPDATCCLAIILLTMSLISSNHVAAVKANDTKQTMGAYIPDKLHLEDMEGNDQAYAISAFLAQGFNQYFFVMHDFKNYNEVKATERLLNASDRTELQIVIILLPPSEGGRISSYNWKGWISYFNDLSERHPSFDGFAIDDFNWISTRNDTKFWKNIDFMMYSNLSQALEHKRGDLKFYPVVYLEGLRTDVVVRDYAKFAKSIILVSASYYDISNLEGSLSGFKKMFGNKSFDYIVYPTITYNYTKQGYDPPSDRLVEATLSIATRVADGIIIWHKIDSHVVQDYLGQRKDPDYLRAIQRMEQLQIADEKSAERRR